MGDSKLFVSSCNRRELALRRPGRAPRWLRAVAMTPSLLTATAIAVGMVAFFAGRGSL